MEYGRWHNKKSLLIPSRARFKLQRLSLHLLLLLAHVRFQFALLHQIVVFRLKYRNLYANQSTIPSTVSSSPRPCWHKPALYPSSSAPCSPCAIAEQPPYPSRRPPYYARDQPAQHCLTVGGYCTYHSLDHHLEPSNLLHILLFLLHAHRLLAQLPR